MPYSRCLRVLTSTYGMRPATNTRAGCRFSDSLLQSGFLGRSALAPLAGGRRPLASYPYATVAVPHSPANRKVPPQRGNSVPFGANQRIVPELF